MKNLYLKYNEDGISDDTSYPYLYIIAIMYGNLLCLKHLYSIYNDNTSYPNILYKTAAIFGHLNILEFLNEKVSSEIKTFSNVAEISALYGHTDCFIFLHKNGYYIHNNLINELGSISIKILQYLNENHYYLTNISYKNFIRENNIEGVKYVYNNNKQIRSIYTCRYAAEFGRLDILKLGWNISHTHGILWNITTLNIASINNHTDCLLYAYNNRYPGYRKFHNQVKDILIKKNRKIFVLVLCLLRMINNFKVEYYLPGNKKSKKLENKYKRV